MLMSFFERFIESRQQRHQISEIRLQAAGAAEVIADRLQNGAAAPHRFNASHPPRGMNREEYLLRVGETAAEHLVIMEGVTTLEFNPDLSRQATDEMPVITPLTKVVRKPDDVIVVFTEQSPPLP